MIYKLNFEASVEAGTMDLGIRYFSSRRSAEAARAKWRRTRFHECHGQYCCLIQEIETPRTKADILVLLNSQVDLLRLDQGGAFMDVETEAFDAMKSCAEET